MDTIQGTRLSVILALCLRFLRYHLQTIVFLTTIFVVNIAFNLEIVIYETLSLRDQLRNHIADPALDLFLLCSRNDLSALIDASPQKATTRGRNLLNLYKSFQTTHVTFDVGLARNTSSIARPQKRVTQLTEDFLGPIPP